MRPTKGTALPLCTALCTAVIVTLCGGQELEKEVVVIGGGIAGLSAARRITNEGRGRFNVRVFEARRERYGGRVWTDRLKNPKARGLEVDLGAFALNVGSPQDNPLLNLTRDMGLEWASLGGAQFIVPWDNHQKFSGDDLARALAEAGAILKEAVRRSREEGKDKKDVSLRAAVDRELGERDVDPLHLHTLLLQALNTYLLPDYSSHLYQPHSLDLGYDRVLLDGMGELLDRLASGTEEESPLKINLRSAVRQVKVDRSQAKVVIRLKDGSQVTADEVVVAVPLPVLARGDLMFEPPLPKPYVTSINNIGMTSSNKVIVEFDAPFWPGEPGVFITAVVDEADRGCLQKWINIHKVMGLPVLMGMVSGPHALRMEKLSDSELQDLVLFKLLRTFGEGSVSSSNIVSIRRSSWMSDPWTGGGTSYPSVGDKGELWDTFSEPWCPMVHFAGEHTTFRHHGTLHGAYMSGQRAAEHILSGYCKQKAEEEERRRKAEEERKKKMEKEKKGNKTKKEASDDQEQSAGTQTVDEKDEL